MDFAKLGEVDSSIGDSRRANRVVYAEKCDFCVSAKNKGVRGDFVVLRGVSVHSNGFVKGVF
jgi:hypothetical protein